jgi:hypothetical protein
MRIGGFDWDAGNWPKCARHGVTREAPETAFAGEIVFFDDPFEASVEARYRAIADDGSGRKLFVVFCFRVRDGAMLVRPISARYMHAEEVEDYDRRNEET